MKKIVNIVESLEDSSLLPEGVSEAIPNKAKSKEEDFTLGTQGASLLGKILTGKGRNRAGKELLELAMEIKKGRKATTKGQNYENKMDF